MGVRSATDCSISPGTKEVTADECGSSGHVSQLQRLSGSYGYGLYSPLAEIHLMLPRV